MNNNFKKINEQLNEQINNFEKEHGKDFSFYLNQNDPLVHSMKVKGELFKNIDLDSEFENADLLDLLGYERIISCKKKSK